MLCGVLARAVEGSGADWLHELVNSAAANSRKTDTASFASCWVERPQGFIR
jgi:hypothetical protein